jgi:hypothetical protein
MKKNTSRSRGNVKLNGFSSEKKFIEFVDKMREEVLDGRCRNCDNHFPNEDLQLGHIIPSCMGGLYVKENVRPLCDKCNKEEGGKINPKFLSSIYHFSLLFNNRVIKRRSGAAFKSGKITAIINGVFFSEVSNSWCFSTICGSTIDCNKVFFVKD